MADHTYRRVPWYNDANPTPADGADLVSNLGMRRFLIESHNGQRYGAEEIVELRSRAGGNIGFENTTEIIEWFVDNLEKRGYQCYKITEILNGYTYRGLRTAMKGFPEYSGSIWSSNVDVLWYDKTKEPLLSFNISIN